MRQWLSSARVKALARWLRVLAYILLALTAVFLVLLFIHQGLLPLAAWLIPALKRPFLDFAVYGSAPTRRFVSFDLEAPKPWRTLWDKSCDGGHILVGPNGPAVPAAGPVILDTDGELVWMSTDYDTIMNFNIQTYRGQEYLTFWAGNKKGGTGKGDMIMLDSNYKVAYRIRAVGQGNKGDLHEFRITKDGTALVTVYNITQADLRDFGGFRPKEGWLTDGVFQEIDIETNELLFEWRAIEHFNPKDTYYFDPFGGYFKSHPFDYYHLNSIEKDSKGNYLCSSRHYHHVINIDGRTGEVLWELGGHGKDFKDLSGGKASEHQWQHNARWVDEEKGILSLLDNGVAGPLHVDAPYSKGTIVQLDLENMTATRLHSYVSNTQVRAASQGNVQIIDDDQVLVGWGATAAYSEFTMDGTPLCEVHFGASSLFWWERFKTYRVYRHFGWVGKPHWPPSAKIQGNSLYVSWNGATEVKYWELQGARKDDEDFQTLDVIPKTHFEDSFVLPTENDYVQWRVTALDHAKNALDTSNVATKDESASGLGVIVGISLAIGLAIGVYFAYRISVRRRQQGKRFFAWSPAELLGRHEYQYSKL